MSKIQKQPRPKFRVGQKVVGVGDGRQGVIASRSFIDEEWNYEVVLTRFRWENELRLVAKK